MLPHRSTLKRQVIGFDINIQSLRSYDRIDSTNETDDDEPRDADSLLFTSDPSKLAGGRVSVDRTYSIDINKRPDLSPLEKASVTVGRALKSRAFLGVTTQPLVIYESTVYPGATEEFCAPIIERESGLLFNQDFYCGYIPERINPGDSEHRLPAIVKVTSGSTKDAATWVDNFYGSIIKAGTHLAPSLKVAEAAKVIENTQRDLNIALINELAMIFRRMDIDTLDVLEAAGTKWNFLPFRPGLVGGHCIGVDPYYLTSKAEQLGYHPQVVLAGRRINDGMGDWVVEQLVLEMARSSMVIAKSKVLVMGLTFKENCPDLRNTRIIGLIQALQRYGMLPVVVDPWVNPDDARREYGLSVLSEIPVGDTWNAAVVAVSHFQFKQIAVEQWPSSFPAWYIFRLKGYSA